MTLLDSARQFAGRLAVAALEHATDELLHRVHAYSPGQPADRFTLQLSLMTQRAE